MDEITAEYQTDQLASVAELRVRPRVTIAAKTDLGRIRENNEDKFEFYVPENEVALANRGLVFLVCDGMGGHEAGQIASELACKTFIDVYLNHPSAEAETAISSAVSAANRFVLDVAAAVPSRQGMGTTLSALILLQDRAITVQVGDSRVYRYRDGALQTLTRDHTWVEEAVKSKLMSREEAEAHPYRHMLTRAIGNTQEEKPDIDQYDLRVGDVFLLCSDGLTNHVSDESIGLMLNMYPPSEAAWKLVTSALIDGGSDNCTVLVVRVDALEPVNA